MLHRWIVALVASAGLGNAAFAQVDGAAVTGGRVQGVVADGVVAFKGIPFAAPPLGELRWKAPQPVRPWSGVRKADHFGPSCMQDANFAKLFGAPPQISEDCLYLNVWTPARSPADRLPVMVWIYGGGFVGGMTSIPVYDGTRLARKGVVLVSVGYRLGAFGFLAHPELSRESGTGSGNYGLEDQIAALAWVRANIARFGGDPARITLFGESAGGMSVSLLAGSPRAKGLFQRAISESGGALGPPRRDDEAGASGRPLALAEVAGQRFLEKLGARDIAAARALPAEAIQKAVGPGLAGGFSPVIDGHLLLGDQYLLYQRGRFNDTPVLIGTNSDEGSLSPRAGVTVELLEKQTRERYGARAQTVLAAYPHATDAQALKAAQDMFRDSTFGWHTWAWALLQSSRGHGKAYVYYFDHRTAQTPNGSPHASELGFVFGNLGGPGAGPAGLAGPPTPEEIQLSETMSSYWVNFAKSGDPNGPGLPAWPAFSAAAQRVMYLNGGAHARDLPNRPQIEAMDRYFAWRRAQEHAGGDGSSGH